MYDSITRPEWYRNIIFGVLAHGLFLLLSLSLAHSLSRSSWLLLSLLILALDPSLSSSFFKVHMKRNQFFDILQVQHFKDRIPKFEPCLKNINSAMSPLWIGPRK